MVEQIGVAKFDKFIRKDLLKVLFLLKLSKKNKYFSLWLNTLIRHLKYLADNKLDWINVYDAAHYNNVADKYDIYSTPVIYLLDKNKVIKAKQIGAEQVKDILHSIMEEEKNKK